MIKCVTKKWRWFIIYPFAEDFVFGFGSNGNVRQRRLGRFCKQLTRLERWLADGLCQLFKHLEQFRCTRWVQLTWHLTLHQSGEVLVNGRVVDAAGTARLRMRLEFGNPFEEKWHCVVHPQHVHFVVHEAEPLFDGCFIWCLPSIIIISALLIPVIGNNYQFLLTSPLSSSNKRYQSREELGNNLRTYLCWCWWWPLSF